MALAEEIFRGWLDPHGVLREGQAFAPPAPEASFLVFAQADDAELPIARLRAQASRFFAAKLGLTVEKAYDHDAPPPSVDVARVVLAAADTAGTRLVHGRPTSPIDLARAETADLQGGSGGLFQLAERCHTAWIVEADGEADRSSLLLSAIFASVLLGPILSPSGELFGVRTARLKLEVKPGPYR